jgi:hypothetical protein
LLGSSTAVALGAGGPARYAATSPVGPLPARPRAVPEEPAGRLGPRQMRAALLALPHGAYRNAPRPARPAVPAVPPTFFGGRGMDPSSGRPPRRRRRPALLPVKGPRSGVRRTASSALDGSPPVAPRPATAIACAVSEARGTLGGQAAAHTHTASEGASGTRPPTTEARKTTTKISPGGGGRRPRCVRSGSSPSTPPEHGMPKSRTRARKTRVRDEPRRIGPLGRGVVEICLEGCCPPVYHQPKAR